MTGTATVDALARLDQRIDEAVAVGATSCKERCDACCHYPTLVRPWEVARLRAARRALPVLVRRTVDKQAARAVRTLAGIRRFDGFPAREEDRLAYCAAHIRCPFLVHRRCSVYEVRPVVCRTHFVASAPALCEGGTQPVVTLDLTRHVERLDAELTAAGVENESGELLIDVLTPGLGPR